MAAKRVAATTRPPCCRHDLAVSIASPAIRVAGIAIIGNRTVASRDDVQAIDAGIANTARWKRSVARPQGPCSLSGRSIVPICRSNTATMLARTVSLRDTTVQLSPQAAVRPNVSRIENQRCLRNRFGRSDGCLCTAEVARIPAAVSQQPRAMESRLPAHRGVSGASSAPLLSGRYDAVFGLFNSRRPDNAAIVVLLRSLRRS